MGLTLFRTLAFSGLLLGSTAGATGIDKLLFGPSATCNCKGAGDCTCPKGKCKCKKCGNSAHQKQKLIETLRGSTESTELPNTARHDARGGVFI